MEDWVFDHMGGVLIAIEIMWVGGVLAVFGLYFVVRRNLRKRKITPP